MLTLLLAHQLLPGSKLVGNPATVFSRVHTDTRSLQAGDLFVALQGERYDAHDFLPQLRPAGAAAAISTHGLQANGLPGLEVADTKVALGLLAKNWRAHLQAGQNIPLIAVTGSNGKTTLTQMIASILQAWQGESALATRGNFNNDIGVPLTLLRLNKNHTCAVIELGMNHAGEIAELAAMSAPTVAVINNAQREHQEFMGTVEAVARENGAVLAALPADGVAVFPADDAYSAVWQEMSAGRTCLSFALHPLPNPSPLKGEGESSPLKGEGKSSPLKEKGESSPLKAEGESSPLKEVGESSLLKEVGESSPLSPRGRGLGRGGEIVGNCHWQEGAWQVIAQTPVGEIRYALHMAGRHNVKNSLAAVACAIAAKVPSHFIHAGLEAFSAVNGRSKTTSLMLHGQAVTLVDDSYNANPDSVIAAIDMLMDLPAPRLLVLGDMGEVGDHGPQFHAEVGAYARSRGIDQFWTIGDLCRHAGGVHFADMESLLNSFATAAVGGRPIPTGDGICVPAATPGQPLHGDVRNNPAALLVDPATFRIVSKADDVVCPASILIKGSRFMKMERVVRHIEGLSHAA